MSASYNCDICGDTDITPANPIESLRSSNADLALPNGKTGFYMDVRYYIQHDSDSAKHYCQSCVDSSVDSIKGKMTALLNSKRAKR